MLDMYNIILYTRFKKKKNISIVSSRNDSKSL